MGIKEAGILIGIMYFGGCAGQGFFGDDWGRGLSASIHRLTDNIQRNVHELTKNIQKDVQTQVNEMRAQLNTADGSLTNIGGSNSVIINGSGGSSRTIYSGSLPNGEPYFSDIEEKIVGDKIYRIERTYDPKTKTIKESRYTIDPKNPTVKTEVPAPK